MGLGLVKPMNKSMERAIRIRMERVYTYEQNGKDSPKVLNAP